LERHGPPILTRIGTAAAIDEEMAMGSRGKAMRRSLALAMYISYNTSREERRRSIGHGGKSSMEFGAINMPRFMAYL
jgi:hypothetical protein